MNGTSRSAWSHPLIGNSPVTADAYAAVHVYAVARGDTLASIASRLLGSPARWPDLWWWNRDRVKDPNVIEVGQLLTIYRWRPPYASWEGYVTAQAGAAIPKPPPPKIVTTAAPAGDHEPDGDADDAGAAVNGPAQQAQPAGQVSTMGMGGFEQCVISRESGGNPNVWNASAHWGLFQFSESTWYAAGAAPGTFGNASAGYQEQIFQQAYALWGTQPWAPSDGC